MKKKMTQAENNTSAYPSWICEQCAIKNGGKYKDYSISTWHIHQCGWCQEFNSVTDPRDFGYPHYKGQ